MDKIEKRIRQVNATMAMEGMPLTDEDKERLRNYSENTSRFNEILQGLIDKYTALAAQEKSNAQRL